MASSTSKKFSIARRTSNDRMYEMWKEANSQIATLLDNLSDSDNPFMEMKNTLSRSDDILGKVGSSILLMQTTFADMLASFKSGTLTAQDFEKLLTTENAKGIFSLQVADEVTVLLKVLFENMSSIVKRIQHGGDIPNDDINKLVKTLDRSLGVIESLSTVAVATPMFLASALEQAEINKTKLTEDPRRGYFMKLTSKVGKAITGGYRIQGSSAIHASSAARGHSHASGDDNSDDGSGSSDEGSSRGYGADQYNQHIKHTVIAFQTESKYKSRQLNLHRLGSANGIDSISMEPPAATTVTSAHRSSETQTPTKVLVLARPVSVTILPGTGQLRERRSGSGLGVEYSKGPPKTTGVSRSRTRSVSGDVVPTPTSAEKLKPAEKTFTKTPSIGAGATSNGRRSAVKPRADEGVNSAAVHRDDVSASTASTTAVAAPYDTSPTKKKAAHKLKDKVEKVVRMAKATPLSTEDSANDSVISIHHDIAVEIKRKSDELATAREVLEVREKSMRKVIEAAEVRSQLLDVREKELVALEAHCRAQLAPIHVDIRLPIEPHTISPVLRTGIKSDVIGHEERDYSPTGLINGEENRVLFIRQSEAVQLVEYLNVEVESHVVVEAPHDMTAVRQYRSAETQTELEVQLTTYEHRKSSLTALPPSVAAVDLLRAPVLQEAHPLPQPLLQHALKLDALALMKIVVKVMSFLPSESPAGSRGDRTSTQLLAHPSRGECPSPVLPPAANLPAATSSPLVNVADTTSLQHPSKIVDGGIRSIGILSSGSKANLQPLSIASVSEGISAPADHRRHRQRVEKPSPVRSYAVYPINTAHKSTDCLDLFPLPDVSCEETKDPIRDPSRRGYAAMNDFFLDSLEEGNPLMSLYEAFSPHLNPIARARLLQAAQGDVSAAAFTNFSKLFAALFEELRVIRDKIAQLERGLAHVQGEVEDYFHEKSCTKGQIEFLHENIFCEAGALTVIQGSLQLLMAEYRTIFESVSASELAKVPNLTLGTTDYQQCLKTFNDCQGRLVLVGRALPDLRTTLQSLVLKRPLPASSVQSAEASASSEAVRVEMARLKIAADELATNLRYSLAEVARLQGQLLEATLERDRTPGALLFFAALQDDGAVPTLQQLALQLAEMKTFIEGAAHFDFLTLRKRLQVCVNCLPNLSLFITRYTALHGRWLRDTARSLSDGGYSVGGRGGLAICPLCHVDSRSTAGSALRMSVDASEPHMYAHSPVGTTSKAHKLPPAVASPSSSPVRREAHPAHSSLSLPNLNKSARHIR